MTGEVVVIGPPGDHQVVALTGAIAALGRAVHVLHIDPGRVDRWQWSETSIIADDGSCLTDAVGVFVRSIPFRLPDAADDWVRPEDEIEWGRRAMLAQRNLGFLRSVQQALTERGGNVINPMWSYTFHRSKPSADQVLARAGLRVPRGLVSSDATEITEFARELDELVYKPVGGGGRCVELDVAQIDERRLALQSAPVYFQERVRGRNLRVYAVDGEILACFDIESDEVDYRGNEGEIRAIDPPPGVSAAVLVAASALGLRFAGTDLKLEPDGGIVVIDVNPSPMFAGLDRRADGVVARGLARALTGTSP